MVSRKIPLEEEEEEEEEGLREMREEDRENALKVMEERITVPLEMERRGEEIGMEEEEKEEDEDEEEEEEEEEKDREERFRVADVLLFTNTASEESTVIVI